MGHLLRRNCPQHAHDPCTKQGVHQQQVSFKGRKVSYQHNPRLDEREITLPFNMTAKDSDTFMTNYARFCEEVLAKGELVIRTRFQPNVWYRCIYLSCTQFSQFIQEMAKFSLKLNEPDPSDRGETSKYTSYDSDKEK